MLKLVFVMFYLLKKPPRFVVAAFLIVLAGISVLQKVSRRIHFH